MPRIKQVLRCYVAGNGTRTISSLMDISRNTVKKYITTFNQSGKTIEEILAMDEPNLLRHFNEKPNPYPSQPKSERRTNLKSIPILREKGIPNYAYKKLIRLVIQTGQKRKLTVCLRLKQAQSEAKRQ